MDPTALLTYFRALLAEIVREEVQDAVESTLLSQLPEVLRRARYGAHLTREEAADYLGISLRTLDYRRSEGKLPFEKVGGRVLIPVEACEAYLRRGYVPARSTTGREVQQ